MNIQTLKTRAGTAVVFVLIMLCGLFLNEWTFIGLFSIIFFGCLFEFIRITRLIYGSQFLFYTSFASLYILMPILMMLDLGLVIKTSDTGGYSFVYAPLLPCAILFSVWINDTMAYIVGSLIGRTPFSSISPKKTWEGTVGGAILCVAVITWLGSSLSISQGYDPIHWAILSSIVAVFGTLGDLFESKLKRSAGIKDSGKIMPGHGGFLDRFDSMLVATPFVWLLLRIFLIPTAS